jgi:TolA-binding protein
MSKEQLYTSMGLKNSLSREKMNDHLSGKEKLDETNLDAFDKEALEGWNSIGAKSANNARLDRKFSRQKNKTYILLGIAVLLGIGAMLYYTNFNKLDQQKVQLAEQKGNFVDETDIFIAEKFDTLIEAKIQNQEEIQLLKNQHEAQPIIVTETKPDPIFEIDKLPILEVKSDVKEIKVQVTNKRKIKEIYLSDFKLVDYRVIRSKPTIETKQLDLTGTAANQESKNTSEDDAVWRTMNIPYIDFIEKSMYTLNKGGLKKALARFEVILSSYPDDINALFYSGFVSYSLGDYERALFCFSSTLQNEIANFDEEALWYVGLTYEKQGKKSKAREIFESISKSKSYYAKEASAKL